MRTVGVLLIAAIVGCQPAARPRVRGASGSRPGPSVSPSPGAEVTRATPGTTPGARPGPIAARKTSRAIVVRAEYRRARGPCIHGADGSWAMPQMDSFKVIEVLQGRLKATVIDVRPMSPRGPAYPDTLTEGASLTLRLALADETSKQADENEREDVRWLFVDGDEVEVVTAPADRRD